MTKKPTYAELEQKIKALEEETVQYKRVAAALKESEERLKEALKLGKMGFWEFDLESEKTTWSDQIYELFDRDIREGPPHYSVNTTRYDPKDVERMYKNVLRTIETGESYAMDFRGNFPSGKTVYFYSTYHPVKDKNGRVVKIKGTVQDITDRKQTEAALRESEEKLRVIFENVNDHIIYLDHLGTILDMNKDVSIFGYTREEAIGKKFTEFSIFSPDKFENLMELFADALEGRIHTFTELEGLKKDGSEIIFEVGTSVIKKDDEIKNIVAVIRDITEKKKLEAQLGQAHRMEAIGTLAGGIAHDFNNLLMGIQGRTSLMLTAIGPSHPHFEHLKGIETYVKNAADLTKQLLGFARGGKYEVTPTDLNRLIKEQNQMFGRTKKEISIHAKFEQDLWTAEVDRGQMRQVVLNLFVNAWQSMPGGGDLYVQTENVHLDKKYTRPYEVAPGKYIKISITDTGVGMDDATCQRIFDPFFTTREMGRGTGLGLASVYGIIKNHDGFINVYSEKGHGTTFNIYLPVSEKEITEKIEPPKETLTGRETILLVDDEEMILDVGKGLLEQLGYKVLTAKSGKEALDVYGSEKDRIDLVILDMIMPHMGGGETFDRLKGINPQVNTLLSTGYSMDGEAAKIIQRGCKGFIQKPFNLIELSQKIRELLDKE